MFVDTLNWNEEIEKKKTVKEKLVGMNFYFSIFPLFFSLRVWKKKKKEVKIKLVLFVKWDSIVKMISETMHEHNTQHKYKTKIYEMLKTPWYFFISHWHQSLLALTITAICSQSITPIFINGFTSSFLSLRLSFGQI